MLSNNQTVEEARTELVTKVGEKISLRRFSKISDAENLGCYSHGSRIGTIVSLSGGDGESGKRHCNAHCGSKPNGCSGRRRARGNTRERV